MCSELVSEGVENLHFYTLNRLRTDPLPCVRPWRGRAKNIAVRRWRKTTLTTCPLGSRNNGHSSPHATAGEFFYATPCRNTPRFTEASPKRLRLAGWIHAEILDRYNPGAIGATMGFICCNDISDRARRGVFAVHGSELAQTSPNHGTVHGAAGTAPLLEFPRK